MRMISVDDVRRLALSLPRTHEALVRDQIKFRVGRIVYLAISPDETVMGFAFPKEERAALIAAEPEKFHMPRPSDERYNWVHVRLAAIGHAELREIVIEAWRMVVPKRLAAAHLDRPADPASSVTNEKASSITNERLETLPVEIVVGGSEPTNAQRGHGRRDSE